MKNKINEIIVGSLNTYIKYLEDNCYGGLVLFRGQAEDRPLLPKIARAQYKWKNNILKTECAMFEEFKRKSRPYLNFKPESDWDWLALAQHYGLVTRLLDWTKNPLAALWFLVADPKKLYKEYGIIWMFPVTEENIVDASDKLSPFECDSTKVFQPNHITKRIVAQDGWFTVHKYVKSGRKFLRFETLKKYRKLLTKIMIPYESFDKIRNQLNQCGINSASIFPDLDGLCSHIVWDNSSRKSEREEINDALRFETEALRAITLEGGLCPTHHLKTQVGFSIGGHRMIIDAILDGPEHLYLIEVKNSTKIDILIRAWRHLIALSKSYTDYLKSEEITRPIKAFIIAPDYEKESSRLSGVPILKYDKKLKKFVNKDFIYRFIFGTRK
ncbi:MAG: FRG domain-containing protein [Candidatus Omnitrophica bacterium]|nr:FRG domain-containing protein [Candidatus Omnitrophota bacterium]